MSGAIILEFIHNISELMAASIAYTMLLHKIKGSFVKKKIIVGVLLGIIGIAIMYNPIVAFDGIYYDSRSILLSVAGLFYGLVPTAIAAAFMIVFRIYEGGLGTATGILLILSTAASGIAWKLISDRAEAVKKLPRWLEYYAFGVAVHIIMLLLTFTLPQSDTVDIVSKIALPVLFLYPLGILLLCIVHNSFLQGNENQIALKNSESRLKNAQAIAHVGNWELNTVKMMVWLSEEARRIFGFDVKAENVSIKQVLETISRQERKTVIGGLKELIHNGVEFDMVFSLKGENEGRKKVVHSKAELRKNESGTVLLGVIQDITAQKEAEDGLREIERSKAVLISNLPGMVYRCKYDERFSMQFVSDGCYDLTGYKPDELQNNSLLSYMDIISHQYIDMVWNTCTVAINQKTSFKLQYEIRTASGEAKWVWEQGQGVYNEDGGVDAIEGLIIDITENKKREEEITYLYYHDTLTSLYNRAYFEEARSNLDAQQYLPLSIIIGDIDGLKLINDAFGHTEGDNLLIGMARVISTSIRSNDIASRIGGDEFCILLPNTNEEQVHEVTERIRRACEKYCDKNVNNYFTSISLGYATKSNESDSFEGILRKAEEYMYRHKLLEHKSLHNSVINSIKATMFEKSFETEEHAERLCDLTRKLAGALGLSDDQIVELELLSTLHDIGKISVDLSILSKIEKLTEDDWAEIRRHPEVGYRITQVSPELKHISEFILSHHERWDGTGYPQGLSGESIPLLSRILAVADAFDAMTHNRAYRQPLSVEGAKTEIIINAGKQFDPEIAAVFVNKVV